MILTLVRRHIQVFFRDRMAVFFSLLSPLILFVLYVFFLGNLQVNTLRDSLPGVGNSKLHAFVNAWLFAGVLTITTLSTALVALGVFVEDRSSGRFKDFLVAPITRRQMILGYLVAAFAVSLMLTTLVVIVSQVFIVSTGGRLLSGANALRTYGGIVLLCLTFAAIMSFAVTFIRSASAFSAFNTILGTAVGFLAGAYINVGTLPNGVVNVINVLPFAQAASLLRKPFTDQALHRIATNNQAVHQVSDHYGINLNIGGGTLPTWGIVVIFAALVVVFAVLGSWRIGHKIG